MKRACDELPGLSSIVCKMVWGGFIVVYAQVARAAQLNKWQIMSYQRFPGIGHRMEQWGLTVLDKEI